MEKSTTGSIDVVSGVCDVNVLDAERVGRARNIVFASVSAMKSLCLDSKWPANFSRTFLLFLDLKLRSRLGIVQFYVTVRLTVATVSHIINLFLQRPRVSSSQFNTHSNL